jgi:hypothetical protein
VDDAPDDDGYDRCARCRAVVGGWVDGEYVTWVKCSDVPGEGLVCTYHLDREAAGRDEPADNADGGPVAAACCPVCWREVSAEDSDVYEADNGELVHEACRGEHESAADVIDADGEPVAATWELEPARPWASARTQTTHTTT